jgi:hypothetical protein
MPVLVAQITRLVEEAQIRAFDVEADRRDAPLVGRKVREDRREQKLDGAGLGRQP